MRPPAGSRAVAWLETGTASPHQECPPRRSTSDRGGLRVHHWDRSAQGVAHRRRRSTATNSSSVSCRCVRIVDNASGCCAGRRRSNRGCGRSKARPVIGALLAQQLVGAGETVLDVPAALSARARLLDSGRKDKTDAHDARSAAIVALRNRNLRAVALEDHRQVLRLLARRHHQLTAARTRAICRLHAVLCEMIEGGLSKNLSAKRAASSSASSARPTRSGSNANGSRSSSSTRSAAIDQRARRAPSPHRRRRRRRRTRRSPTCIGVGPIVAVLPDRLHAATSAGSRAPGTTPVTTRPHRSKRRRDRRCVIG